MKRVGLLSMVAFLLLALPVAAQVPAASGPSQVAPPGPVQVLEDPAADVKLVSQGQSQDAPEGRLRSLDLLAATMQETATTFVAQVKVTAVGDDDLPVADSGQYDLHFTHKDAHYAVSVTRYVDRGVYVWGELRRYEADGIAYSYAGEPSVVVDAAAGTITSTFPRGLIVDRSGAAPYPGRVLEGIWAEAHWPFADGPFIGTGPVDAGFPADARDRMPDADVGQKQFPVVLGLEQEGNALLSSSDPMRASNGEATTFVFNVNAENTGDTEDLFEMVPVAAPADWAITIPDQFLRLAGKESKEIPVLVSVPFTHSHGDLKTFVLEMQSTSDPATVGRIALGLRYYLIPQPAGHHPQLWFHSQRWGAADDPFYTVFSQTFAGNVGFGSMNAMQEDVSDDKADLTGSWYGIRCCDESQTPQSLWHWGIWLSPSLEMGLDFDLAKTGKVSVPIKTTAPIPQAQVDANLWYWSYDEKEDTHREILVARMQPTAPVDLGAGTTTVFELELKANEAADYLQYRKHAGLFLEINVTSVAPSLFVAAQAPSIAPGGTMMLPLIEYHDPIGDAFAGESDIDLRPVGELSKPVNPGRTVIFQATLVNGLERDATFKVGVEGVNKHWLEMLGPRDITVASGTSQPVRIALHAPDDASPLDAGDFVLTAQDHEDPSQRALVHFVALVETANDIPDEAGLVGPKVEQTKSSPGPALLVVILVVALAAVRRRR